MTEIERLIKKFMNKEKKILDCILYFNIDFKKK